MIAANVWRGIPFVAISLLAGLQTIPQSLHEAASLDGATGWQRFRFITLPMLTPIIAVGNDVLGTVHLHRLPADLCADQGRAGQRHPPDGDIVVPARHTRAASSAKAPAIAVAMIPFLLASILFSFFGLQRRKWQQGGQD